jgi:hypothetical protein
MKIPLLMHRWFEAEGADWAYHPDLEPYCSVCNQALSGNVVGEIGPVGLLPVHGAGLFLVGVRTADPDRARDEFGRLLTVLRVAVLARRPDDREQEELRRLLGSAMVAAHPGPTPGLEVDWPGPLEPLPRAAECGTTAPLATALAGAPRGGPFPTEADARGVDAAGVPEGATRSHGRGRRDGRAGRRGWVFWGLAACPVLAGCVVVGGCLFLQQQPPAQVSKVPSSPGHRVTVEKSPEESEEQKREKQVEQLKRKISGLDLQGLAQETEYHEFFGELPPKTVVGICAMIRREKINTLCPDPAAETGKDRDSVNTYAVAGIGVRTLADNVLRWLDRHPGAPGVERDAVVAERREWEKAKEAVRRETGRVRYQRVVYCVEALREAVLPFRDRGKRQSCVQDLESSIKAFDGDGWGPHAPELTDTVQKAGRWCEGFKQTRRYQFQVVRNLPEGFYVKQRRDGRETKVSRKGEVVEVELLVSDLENPNYKIEVFSSRNDKPVKKRLTWALERDKAVFTDQDKTIVFECAELGLDCPPYADLVGVNPTRKP